DVDGVLQLENLALDLNRDLFGQVALLHRGRDIGDVADLGREIGGELVHVVGEVSPGAGGAEHVGLAAQAAFGADLARDAGDFRGEGVELIDHDVDRVLQVEDLAVDVDRDLLGEIPSCDGGGDIGNIADLGGQITGHRVDVVGEVAPCPRGARYVRLATQPALGADLACD